MEANRTDGKSVRRELGLTHTGQNDRSGQNGGLAGRGIHCWLLQATRWRISKNYKGNHILLFSLGKLNLETASCDHRKQTEGKAETVVSRERPIQPMSAKQLTLKYAEVLHLRQVVREAEFHAAQILASKQDFANSVLNSQVNQSISRFAG